jgi:hypothetical protein
MVLCERHGCMPAFRDRCALWPLCSGKPLKPGQVVRFKDDGSEEVINPETSEEVQKVPDNKGA